MDHICRDCVKAELNHMVSSQIRLFISHSSDDRELAQGLIDLLRAALSLPSSAIRCTSVDGYRLPAGANTDEEIRREVHEAEAFIGILSAQSLRSMYVQFELGARWGAKKHLIPLLAPGTSVGDIGRPISALNVIQANSRAELHQLLTDLAVVLEVTPEAPAAYQRFIDVIVVQKSPSPTTPRGRVQIRVVDNAFALFVNQAKVDARTGASVAVLSVSEHRQAVLKITSPKQDTLLFDGITAGHVWTFEARGETYQMVVTSISYNKQSVSFEIQKSDSAPRPGTGEFIDGSSHIRELLGRTTLTETQRRILRELISPNGTKISKSWSSLSFSYGKAQINELIHMSLITLVGSELIVAHDMIASRLAEELYPIQENHT